MRPWEHRDEAVNSASTVQLHSCGSVWPCTCAVKDVAFFGAKHDRHQKQSSLGCALEKIITGYGQEDRQAATVAALLGISNIHPQQCLSFQPRPGGPEKRGEATKFNVRPEAL